MFRHALVVLLRWLKEWLKEGNLLDKSSGAVIHTQTALAKYILVEKQLASSKAAFGFGSRTKLSLTTGVVSNVFIVYLAVIIYGKVKSYVNRKTQ